MTSTSSDLITIFEQYVSELNQENHDETLPTGSAKHFSEVWNTFLANNFQGGNRQMNNEASETPSSDNKNNTSVKEYQILKNIPQNVNKQSTFFQELNQKMESIITSETDKNTSSIIKFTQNEKLLSEYLNNNNNKEKQPAVVNSYLRKSYSNETVVRNSSNNKVSTALERNESNKIGCNMENAILFETIDDFTNYLEGNKSSIDKLEIYETYSIEKVQQDVKGKCKKKDELITNENFAYKLKDCINITDTEFAKHFKDQVKNHLEVENLNKQRQVINDERNKSDSRKSVKKDSIKSNISLKNTLKSKEIKKIKVKSLNRRNVWRNTYPMRNKLKQRKRKTMEKKIDHKAIDNGECAVNTKKKQLSQYCINGLCEICYTPSENSFTFVMEPMKDDKSQSPQNNDSSSFSKVHIETDEQFKFIKKKHEQADVKSIDNICVNVPLDLNKCGAEKTANLNGGVLKNKVIKGLRVFPVDKEFRSFASFGKLYQLNEEIFEDITDADETIALPVTSEKPKENCFELAYGRPNFNGDANSSMRMLAGREKIDTSKKYKLFKHFVSKVSGNEIIFESVVDVETNEEDDNIYNKECKLSPSEKLQATLLNNIYRSILVKVKRFNSDKSTMDLRNGVNNALDDDQGEVNTFERMLKFTIESLEQEYLKHEANKAATSRARKTETSEAKSTSIIIEEALMAVALPSTQSNKLFLPTQNTKDTRTPSTSTTTTAAILMAPITTSNLDSANHFTTSTISEKLPEQDKNKIIIQQVFNLDRIVHEGPKFNFNTTHHHVKNYKKSSNQTTTTTTTTTTTQSATKLRYNKINNVGAAISSAPENNHKVNLTQNHRPKVNHYNKVSIDRLVKDSSMKKHNKTSSTNKNDLHVGRSGIGGVAAITTTKKETNSSMNQRQHRKHNQIVNNGGTSAFRSPHHINVKMLDGKIIVLKAGNKADERSSTELPKKNSIWNSMIRQTSRLVPFLSLNGAKIDLDSFTELPKN